MNDEYIVILKIIYIYIYIYIIHYYAHQSPTDPRQIDRRDTHYPLQLNFFDLFLNIRHLDSLVSLVFRPKLSSLLIKKPIRTHPFSLIKVYD